MSELSSAQIRELVASVPHWHHIFAFPQGITTPGAYDPRDLFSRLRFPDLRGKRVLDVGTRDGFFAFECERRGAHVVALDHVDAEKTGFAVARRILGSQVEYVRANVYDLTPEEFGHFDVILFLGVLYHLRHPLLALDRLRALAKNLLMVESLVCDSSFFVGYGEARPLASFAPELEDLPLAQFLVANRFHPDWTNKWSPNVACLKALLEDALFAPTAVEVWGERALVHARVVEDPGLSRRAQLDAGLA